MGMFETKCAYCESTEHATDDCPHGILSGNACANCGSKEHATDDCSHGLLSGNECAQCGSVDHATDDCPHGLLSGNKCAQCGSTEHATDDCPHGILSENKCGYCGSKHHSTDQCPQQSTSVQHDYDGDVAEPGELGWLGEKVAMIGGVLGAIAGFQIAMDTADGVTGYLVYTAIGAMAGGLVGSLMAMAIPWMIGLGILALILKACGIG